MGGLRDALAGWRESRHEAGAWSSARTLTDLGELVARFCEGELSETPDHAGPRAPETERIAAPLAHANRQGFITSSSQPGVLDDTGRQRAAVEGWATPETEDRLWRLVAGTRLDMHATNHRPRWATNYSTAVPVSEVATDTGGYVTCTDFGAVPSARDFAHLERPDLTDGCAFVSIIDPEWGDEPLLWERLSEPDWDHPRPLSDEQRRPVEPPVGTVLETRDEIDEYRIERLPDGWAIQYRDGENEYGATHTSGRISWRAAWSAWGPPAGAQPFVEVPADAPALPPRPPEPVPPWVGMGHAASSQRLDLPPAAKPHAPPRPPAAPAMRTSPTTPPTSTSSGASMTTSQGEVNAAVLGSNQHSEAAIHTVHAAIAELEQARAALMAAAQGSQNPQDFEEAARAISATIEHYHEGLPKIQHSMSMVSDAAARR